jgi:hypothetical protein
MAAPIPVVIEAALNGATPKSRNPRVPTAPDEIAADALACMTAGAAIIHTHIDDFALTGPAAAARYLEGWRPVVRARPDAILYCTVAVGGAVADRVPHVPPLASWSHAHGRARPGSMNLGGPGADGTSRAASTSSTPTPTATSGTWSRSSRCRPGRHLDLRARLLRTALVYHRAGRLPRARS